jgi:transposase
MEGEETTVAAGREEEKEGLGARFYLGLTGLLLGVGILVSSRLIFWRAIYAGLLRRVPGGAVILLGRLGHRDRRNPRRACSAVSQHRRRSELDDLKRAEGEQPRPGRIGSRGRRRRTDPLPQAHRQPVLVGRIEPLLPPRPRHPLGCHRPRVPDRDAMDAILLVLRTGMRWNALNATGICSSSSSAHRRFQEWEQAGVFREIWRQGLLEYHRVVGIDWEWLACDWTMGKASLDSAKTGANPTD